MSKKTPLTAQEHQLLAACCEKPEGRGVPVDKEWKKVARALTRKGLTWTMESVFMVCLATDAGRQLMAETSALSA